MRRDARRHHGELGGEMSVEDIPKKNTNRRTERTDAESEPEKGGKSSSMVDTGSLTTSSACCTTRRKQGASGRGDGEAERNSGAAREKWKGRLGLQGSLFMEKDSMGRPSIMRAGYVAALDACRTEEKEDNER
jgi:hypothetical protein